MKMKFSNVEVGISYYLCVRKT